MYQAEISLSLGVGLLLLLVVKKLIDLKKLPPGPWGIPILGYLPFLMFSDPTKVFAKLKTKYGKVFSLKIGNFNVVVLNDHKIISEAFNKDVFIGRPAFDIFLLGNCGKLRGILFGEGSAWSEQRRCVLKNLRKFGFGKHSTMNDLLNFEAQELIQEFNKHVGKPFSPRNTLNASVLNSLWYICTGSRFESDDTEFQFCVRRFTEHLSTLHGTGFAFYFSWAMLPINWIFKKYLETCDRTQVLVKRYIDEHKTTFDPNVTRDVIDALLATQRSTTHPNSSFYGKEGDLNILIDLTDLFQAGAETTSTTIQWAILYMIAFPEVQAKVQEEIDRVLGSRSPSLDDRSLMLYTEATIKETHRYCSLAPLAMAHNTFETTTLEGFTIPKNTVILANTKDSHFDPAYWTNPNKFDPERWIDPIQQKLIKHAAFLPFSSGKRQCLGMELANETLFIFLTTLLQSYKFQNDTSMPGKLSLEPFKPRLLLSPVPYNVIMVPRNC